jgi:lipopolysaccharide transport system permease protein
MSGTSGGLTAQSGVEAKVANMQTRETFVIPEHPLVIIEAGKKWAPLDLRSLWAYRELLYFLAWRDVKVRYKQTALGVAWAVLQPLCTMLIFTIFFGKLAGVPSDGMPYAVFALAGLVPWIFFSNAVTASGNSLVSNANLITKVFFPRLLIPGAAVGAGLVDLAIGLILLLPLMVYYRTPLSWGIASLPLIVLLLALLALGVGLWMSALNVKYRDVRYALPFLIQIWMFVSPVIYPISFLPRRWRWVLLLNPLTGLIENFRAALFGKPLDAVGLLTSAVLTLVVLIYAAFTFRRLEKSFADIV